jgi:hypothetical protein
MLRARSIVSASMPASAFAALLSDGATRGTPARLVRANIGVTTGFAMNPVISAAEVPPLQLRADAAPVPRLGRNPRLFGPLPRLIDLDDALFEADVLEARVSSPTATRAGDQTGMQSPNTA